MVVAYCVQIPCCVNDAQYVCGYREGGELQTQFITWNHKFVKLVNNWLPWLLKSSNRGWDVGDLLTVVATLWGGIGTVALFACPPSSYSHRYLRTGAPGGTATWSIWAADTACRDSVSAALHLPSSTHPVTPGALHRDPLATGRFRGL